MTQTLALRAPRQGIVRRFTQGMKDRDQRRFFFAYLGGKLLAVGLVLVVIKFVVGPFLNSVAGAQDSSTVPVDDVVNATNTAWVLVTAFLVFFMQAGFMMLEAGFARTREVVNILQECIVDTCLCALLFWAFGFALMFGHGNGFIGHEYFFLNGAEATYTYHGSFDTGVAFMAFFLFQFAFADTCSTITSGAMVGRTGFKGDLLYSAVVSGLIYPIFGHWVWGPGGWLGTMSPSFLNDLTGGAVFRDFAGSTVVHTVGGFIAL